MGSVGRKSTTFHVVPGLPVTLHVCVSVGRRLPWLKCVTRARRTTVGATVTVVTPPPSTPTYDSPLRDPRSLRGHTSVKAEDVGTLPRDDGSG